MSDVRVTSEAPSNSEISEAPSGTTWLVGDIRSITKKMGEVMATVTEVPKSGFNQHGQYKYATEPDIVREVRVEMGSRGCFIYPTMQSLEWREGQKTKSGNTNNIATVTMLYAICDSDSTGHILAKFINEGQDTGDKAINKAITACTKYFVKTLFIMPVGDVDDDSDQPGDVDPNSRAAIPNRQARDQLRAPTMQQPKTAALAQKINQRRMEIADVPSGPTPIEQRIQAADPYASHKPVEECTEDELKARESRLLIGVKAKKAALRDEAQKKLDAVQAELLKRMAGEPPPVDESQLEDAPF